MKEIEIKILGVDKSLLMKRLIDLKAQLIQKELQLNVHWFHLKGKHRDDPPYIRIRNAIDGQYEITYKSASKTNMNSVERKEITMKTSDLNSARSFLKEIGLIEYAYQEKIRTSYALGNVRIDIDTYPNMPSYAEIEAGSEKDVLKYIKLLGLSGFERSKEGERALIIKRYGLDWYDMRFK